KSRLPPPSSSQRKEDSIHAPVPSSAEQAPHPSEPPRCMASQTSASARTSSAPLPHFKTRVVSKVLPSQNSRSSTILNADRRTLNAFPVPDPWPLVPTWSSA